MSDLSGLPERLQRLHDLQWRDLTEKHRFTGDHLKWHASPEKRRAAVGPRTISLSSPPPGSNVTFFGSQGETISHEEWVVQRRNKELAKRSDPAVIDTIGVRETVALAKERLAQRAEDLLSFWATESAANSDDFDNEIERLQQSVVREVGSLWESSEWHAAWFERACQSKITDELMTQVKEFKSRASGWEIQHLKNPHLSVRSLFRAQGNLKLAFTFEESDQLLGRARTELSRDTVSWSYQEAFERFRKSNKDLFDKMFDNNRPGAPNVLVTVPRSSSTQADPKLLEPLRVELLRVDPKPLPPPIPVVGGSASPWTAERLGTLTGNEGNANGSCQEAAKGQGSGWSDTKPQPTGPPLTNQTKGIGTH